MQYQRTLLATAVFSIYANALAQDGGQSTQAQAGAPEASIPKVVVTATPFRSGEGDQILTPAKVLAGQELRDKLGGSLGETLSGELGVSASAFGPGSSRPIIRGLEGSRVKMLENGMAVSDLSGLSNDHAVAAEGATAAQIEILRGPAALLYGSGAIGGLVNVVNERIPTGLEPDPFGHFEARYGTVDASRNASASADAAFGKFALHADGNVRITRDYKVPGGEVAPRGELANSAARSDGGGVGGSYVGEWGYAGASVSTLSNLYGVPGGEGARIDLQQTRYDVDALVNAPVAALESVRFKLGYSDYGHTELEPDDTAAIRMENRALETRLEMMHRPLAGMHGTFGIQTENSHYAALSEEEGGHDTVPRTRSRSTAAFLVEEKDIGALRLSGGARIERVTREPDGQKRRSFDLGSYSLGAQWRFMPGYAAGITGSVAERAPATEELYSAGPHEATATFDIGDPAFRKETSRNIELTLQKTEGLVQWQANLFQNKVSDFIYGQVTGNMVDDEGNRGDELRERIFRQAGATIRGVEAELTVNESGPGWSGRVFADRSRGTIDGDGSLPLQPADRIGASLAYKVGAWRAGLSLVHALEQDRLAAFETTTTPAYDQLNASLTYTQRIRGNEVSWFLLAKNLRDEEIRMSTSVLKDVAPLPGRNFVFGVRTRF